MKKCLLIALCFLLTIQLDAGQYNITDFGAVADTAMLSTGAIQSAIDHCAKTGGTVIIPDGSFKTGSLVLRSNVNLHLSKGSVLYGSRQRKDYVLMRSAYVSRRTREKTMQLIYAENAENFSITGEGRIDGQGSAFPDSGPDGVQYPRPDLLKFIRCRKVLVQGIHLKNSGCWMQHYLACDGVRIHKIEVYNHSNKNNDGIDIDGCSNVFVSGVRVDTDDDALCLKSTSGRGCENISISNCILSSHCNAFKMGTESNTGFRNIAVTNLVIRPSAMDDSLIYGRIYGISGISLEMVDGGVLDGITISNVNIEGTAVPLFIRLGSRNRPYTEDMVIDQAGTLKNISINNLRARGARKLGCSISGIPGYPVEAISLSNISVRFEGGGTEQDFLREIPEMERSYPEATRFGILPAYGFFIRHARGISFSNVDLGTEDSDLRPAICLSDVIDATFNGLRMESAPGSRRNLLLENCSNVDVCNSRIKGSSESFAEIRGAKTSGIHLRNNILSGCRRVFTTFDTRETSVREEGNIR